MIAESSGAGRVGAGAWQWVVVESNQQPAMARFSCVEVMGEGVGVGHPGRTTGVGCVHTSSFVLGST
jgi:hypothetical protein